VSDNCIECRARWFLGLEEVTDQCTSAPPVSNCPDGEPEVMCTVDPCSVSTCEDVPGASCVADNCGECSAKWF
jgi:hypothetical protein